MASDAASVWNEVRWSRYCDQSMYYSIHHDGSGISSALLHRIPAKLLQHDGWTTLSAIGWTYRMLAVRLGPVIHDWQRFASLYCFNTVNILCCVRTPHRRCNELRTHICSVCHCFNRLWTVFGVAMNESSGGICFLTDIADTFIEVQFRVDSQTEILS